MSLKKSIKRIIPATKNTIDGLKILWKKECAFRQECYLSLFLTPFILISHIPIYLKLLLFLLLLLLLAVEALNSALEVVVDRISLEIHPQSKIAKDMGSAAVGIVIIMNILSWVYAVYLHVSY